MSQVEHKYAIVYPAADVASGQILQWLDEMNESRYLRPALNHPADAVATAEMAGLRMNYATCLTALVQGVRRASLAKPVRTRGEETYVYRDPPQFGWFSPRGDGPLMRRGFKTNQVRIDQLVWAHAAIYAVVSYASREISEDRPVADSVRIMVVQATALASATKALMDNWIERAQIPHEIAPLDRQMSLWTDILDLTHDACKLRSSGLADALVGKTGCTVDQAFLTIKDGWHDIQSHASVRSIERFAPQLAAAIRIGYARHLIACIEQGYLKLSAPMMDPASVVPAAVAWLKRRGLRIKEVAKPKAMLIADAFSSSEYDQTVPLYLKAHVEDRMGTPYKPLWPLEPEVSKHTALPFYMVYLEQVE